MHWSMKARGFPSDNKQGLSDLTNSCVANHFNNENTPEQGCEAYTDVPAHKGPYSYKFLVFFQIGS